MATELREVGGAEIARAPAGHPGVERHHDRLEAGPLGPPHKARRQIAIGWGVELEESRRRFELGGDSLERIDGQGRGDHRHASQRRGAGGCEIAMAVLGAEPDHANRAHEHGRSQPHAEELDRQVALLRANEHPRPQTPFVERSDIGLLRALVAAAPGDVRDEACWHRRVRLGLQLVKPHRERRQVAAQSGKVNLVLIGPEVGHQSKPSFMASGETIGIARLRRPGCFRLRPSSTSRPRLPRRMISASSGRFASCVP